MAGWALHQGVGPIQFLSGTLIDVHNSGGLPGGDSDTNLIIVPDANSTGLLINRHGKANEKFEIECEIHVTEDRDGRAKFEHWVSTMLGLPVTAIGVWTDDTGHDDKTEIHPMDLMFTRVEGSALPTDWIADLARQHGLQVGTTLFAYRYAAASDNRGEGILTSPPLANQTRATSVTLPFPPRPIGAVSPQLEVRSGGARNAASHFDDVVFAGSTATINLVVTVKDTDHDGPGFDLAEIALFWKGVRSLDIPPELHFGLAKLGEAIVRNFTIVNDGSEPVSLTVPGAPFPSSFEWNGMPSTVLTPGASFTVTVTFSPQAVGTHNGAVSVISDAQGSPHLVSLKGSARNGDPQ